MKQTLVILPKLKEIEKLRKKYNPNHNKYKTHISLVYTFEIKDQKSLFEHIKDSVKNIKPFVIKQNKFYNSKNYVCLGIKSKDCWKFYKSLNKKLFKNFENKQVIFKPHITISSLKDNNESRHLVKQLNKIKINFRYKVDSISLLTLKENNSIKSIKTFRL